MLSNTDVLQVCADMLRRAGMTAAHLAEHMGAPPPAKRSKPMRADDVFARADCAAGVSSTELQRELGVAESTSSALLGKLQFAGRLHRLKLPGVREIRWFVSEEAAQAYRQDHIAVAQAAVSKPAKPPKAIKPPKAPKPPKAAKAPVVRAAPKPPVQPPWSGSVTAGSSKVAPALVGVAIVPEGLVIQRAPTPLGRYEVAPGEALSGGFMAEWQAKRAGAGA